MGVSNKVYAMFRVIYKSAFSPVKGGLQVVQTVVHLIEDFPNIMENISELDGFGKRPPKKQGMYLILQKFFHSNHVFCI